MTTTFDARLAADRGHNIRLFFVIQGIPNVFQEAQDDVPSGVIDSARPRTKLVELIDQGEMRINIDTRRCEGGDLRIDLIDDDDGTLRSLFTPRKRRVSYLGNDIDADDEVITMASTDWADETGVLYMDFETIRYETVDPTSVDAIERGAYGSEAVPHFGNAENGAGIFSSPPSWVSRRVTLKGYFVNDDGTSSSGLTKTLGVFRIEKAPKHMGGKRWSIQCSGLIDEFGSKKIGGGIRDVELPPDSRMRLVGGNAVLKVGAGANYVQFVAGDTASHVLIRGEDSAGNEVAACHRLIGQVDDSNDDSIELDTTRLVMSSRIIDVPKSARHIAVLHGSPRRVALKVITSRLGDATNGSRDTLPGFSRAAEGESDWRFGAGIDADEVDASSFLQYGMGGPWSYVLDDEADLDDFLFELNLETNTATSVSRAGALKLVPLRADPALATLIINRAMIEPGPIAVEYIEESIKPRARVECNYDPISRKYLLAFNWHDADLQRRYPQHEDSREIASKSIVVDGYTQGTPAGRLTRVTTAQSAIEQKFRSLMVADGRGRAQVSMVLNGRALLADVGDIVDLSADVLDLEGNASVSNRLARIIAMRPRYKAARVDVTLQLLDKLFRIAPACIIASAVDETLTLRTNGPEIPDANPGRMFADGAAVRVFDVSGAAYEQFTVVSHTDTTVELDGIPSFGIEANIDFLYMDLQANNNGSTTNDNGYTPRDYLYQMPDDENDPTVALVTRWS